MSTDLRRSFRLAFITSEVDMPVPSVPELLARVRSSPVWDGASIVPVGAQFPRVHLEWRAEHGFVIQCFEDDQSWSYFLASTPSFAAPSIDIELGGQALERWPSELFVSAQVAHQALEYFLDFGKQDPALNWVRIDAFPRETVWEGREGRQAWERTSRTPSDI